MIRTLIKQYLRGYPSSISNKTTIAKQQYSFSKITTKSIMSFSMDKAEGNTQTDELKKYQEYLRKHNLSLKKPHEKLRNEEERIINKYMATGKQSEVIAFLTNNVDHRLCHPSTTSTLDKELLKKYQTLNNTDKIWAAFALISFRQPKFFNHFTKNIEEQLTTKKVEEINIDELIVYLYGQIILFKDLTFLKKIKLIDIAPNKTLEIIHQCLNYRKYQGRFNSQLTNLSQYLELKMNPSLNKIQPIDSRNKKQSLLEVDVEAFFKVLGYKFTKQMSVNGYLVDFIIENQEGEQKMAVEVNGNYHYTLTGKLQGRDILRNVIVNSCLPLKIIHHQDFLLSKGYRNKLAYIENILHSSSVNWECKNRGIDSKWQVTKTEGLQVDQ